MASVLESIATTAIRLSDHLRLQVKWGARMNNKLALKDTFRFDEPGTLMRPGPIGRIVRLSLGALCLWLVWQLVTRSGIPDLYNPSFWVMAAFGLVLAPYVVNIGFGVTWGAWPRMISGIIILVVAAFSFAEGGSVLGAPLWATVAIWMIYIYGHLGISFLLSAILATPGCEMRALPHLLGMVFRNDTREHYCPGFIENVDQWEQSRGTSAGESDDDESLPVDVSKSDLLGNAGRQLLVYGVPFLALQLAGNLGGFTIATAVPALAFLIVGVVCSINAWRSRRVHCYFMGPWCLAAAAMTALYSLRIIDFGPGTWSMIVNTGLAGAVIIHVTTERIWGKYFGQR